MYDTPYPKYVIFYLLTVQYSMEYMYVALCISCMLPHLLHVQIHILYVYILYAQYIVHILPYILHILKYVYFIYCTL
jgi:hypothetical protein